MFKTSCDQLDNFLTRVEQPIVFQNRMLDEAFLKSLEGHKKSEQEHAQTLTLYHRTFLQRLTRVINDLFDIFFSAECQKIYKPLVFLSFDNSTRKVDSINKDKHENKISIALGQVVQLCIHFAQALNITLLHHMVFNGKKSMIYHKANLTSRAARVALSEAA